MSTLRAEKTIHSPAPRVTRLISLLSRPGKLAQPIARPALFIPIWEPKMHICACADECDLLLGYARPGGRLLLKAHDLNGSHHIRPQSHIARRLYIYTRPSPNLLSLHKEKNQSRLPSLLLSTSIGDLLEYCPFPSSMYPHGYSITSSLTYIPLKISSQCPALKSTDTLQKRVRAPGRAAVSLPRRPQ